MYIRIEIGGTVNLKQHNRLIKMLEEVDGNTICAEPGVPIYMEWDEVGGYEMEPILKYLSDNCIEYDLWFSDEDDNSLSKYRKGEGIKRYETDVNAEPIISMSIIKNILDHSEAMTKDDLIERLKVELEPLYTRELQPYQVDESLPEEDIFDGDKDEE